MKALLKSGEWVEIDTTCLFNNQYNTKDGKRIFDQDISCIIGDIRHGLGKCRYCGALVKKGKKKNTFQNGKIKIVRDALGIKTGLSVLKSNPLEVDTTINENGEAVTRKTVVTISKYEKVCTYRDKYGECSHKECRRMGIEWFTPENTFFLKYPNGFSAIPEIDTLKMRGFVMNDHVINAKYFKKIGSYTLKALLSYEDGKATGIKAYMLYNTRHNYIFRFENGELFTNKYSFGWYRVKTLEGIPTSVMDAVKKICYR